MNESHLDPDIHLCPEIPDDCCYECGKKFPADAEIEADFPMFRGYCSQACEDKHKKQTEAV